MKFTITVIFTAVALFATAPTMAEQATVEQFNVEFVEANDLRKQSGKLSHEWRDTAKILKFARKAAEQGDLEKAIKLIAQAKFQSEAAIVQARREKELWKGRVVR